MDPATIAEIFAFITKLLGLVPLVIQAGGDVVSILSSGRTALLAMETENRGPNQAEWSNLDATIAGYMGQLKDPTTGNLPQTGATS